MSSEYISPEIIARHAATSLAVGDSVNDLPYNKIALNASVLRVDDRCQPAAPISIVYYPAGVISEESVSAGFLSGAGDPPEGEVIQKIIESACGTDVMQEFARLPAVADIVEFTREAYYRQTALEAARHNMLRFHQAPLAAIALTTTVSGCRAIISTPYFVWPWTAFAEMKNALE